MPITFSTPSLGDGKVDVLRQTILNLGGSIATVSGGEGELIQQINNLMNGAIYLDDNVAQAPTNGVADIDRRLVTSGTLGFSASGTLQMVGITLPKNLVVSNFNYLTGTQAAITPTNQWAALYDNNRNLLAISANGGAGAIAASTAITYPVANVAAGAATSFVTTYPGMYYFGILVVATGAMPTLSGGTGLVAATQLAPIVAGISNTGLTVPQTFPTVATALTASAIVPYVWVS
jgi:hypothetical protein